jgi:hypothetical protein
MSCEKTDVVINPQEEQQTNHELEDIINAKVVPYMEEYWSDFSYEIEHVSMKTNGKGTFSINCYHLGNLKSKLYVDTHVDANMYYGEATIRELMEKKFKYWNANDEMILEFANHEFGFCSPEPCCAQFILAIVTITLCCFSINRWITANYGDALSLTFLTLCTVIIAVTSSRFYKYLRTDAKTVRYMIRETKHGERGRYFQLWKHYVNEKKRLNKNTP